MKLAHSLGPDMWYSNVLSDYAPAASNKGSCSIAKTGFPSHGAYYFVHTKSSYMDRYRPLEYAKWVLIHTQKIFSFIWYP